MSDQIHVQATEYTYSVFPDGHPLRRHYTVYVSYRGDGRWAVTDGFMCLHRDGVGWDFEPSGSNRENQWLTDHRFTLLEAARHAMRIAPLLECNGRTATQALDSAAGR